MIYSKINLLNVVESKKRPKICIQFVPTIKSIRFLDLVDLYTIVTTHAEQTCPNRRRLPKGDTQPEAINFHKKVNGNPLETSEQLCVDRGVSQHFMLEHKNVQYTGS